MNYQKVKLWKQSHLSSHQKEYLGINLPNKVKDLYLKNCTTMVKKIEDDTTVQKINCVHALEEYC